MNKTIDIARLKRQVAKVKAKLNGLENDSAGDYVAERIQELHDALHIGLTVLEDELGVRLTDDGDVATFSGGSGKDRPDVGGE